ncbi:MAG: glycosyltransferase family 2 protein [Nocardioides sp.]
MTNRSRPFSVAQRIATLGPLCLFVGYVVWADLGWASRDVLPLLGFYVLVCAMTLTIMVSGVFWRSFTHLPPAEGRILAIVPSYNEEPEHLRETVLALANQTIPPDEIHVIDDGSVEPVVPFDHPLVTWHRQRNGGKRDAQVTVLRQFSASEWDFIFTVDSDSVPDPDALEHLLRSMSNPGVQAATGMIFVANRKDNLLTRLVDINVVTSCVMFRSIRSWFGIVTPTSGALALYRSGLVYDNLDDYLTSGTIGDDRRLSFYALLRGDVVGVSEAVVECYYPNTVRGTFYQRLRWSKSAWLGIPFVLSHLRLLVVAFYMYPLVFSLMFPFMVLVIIKVSADYDHPVWLYAVVFWQVVAISMTGIYAIYRRQLTLSERLKMWCLSPLYPVFGLLILRTAAYWALVKLRKDSWYTREYVPTKHPTDQAVSDSRFANESGREADVLVLDSVTDRLDRPSP